MEFIEKQRKEYLQREAATAAKNETSQVTARSVDPTLTVKSRPKMLLIEFCCNSNSTIGQSSGKFNMFVLRITEKDDATKMSTINSALEVMSSYEFVGIHGSLPCTGWSCWWHMILATSSGDRRTEMEKRQSNLRQTSQLLVAHFLILARKVAEKSGSISFEWPRHCAGWLQQYIQELLLELHMSLISVDAMND